MPIYGRELTNVSKLKELVNDFKELYFKKK